MSAGSRLGRRKEEGGAIAVLTALVAVVLLLVAALTVDMGNAWARRGLLQVQADQAAVYAAAQLPATTSATRFTVAKAAAWYIACHPVTGQQQLDPTLPSCPTSTTSPTLDSYAQRLLDTGRVAFPRSNQVQVVSPDARVDFGFARIAGASGTVQQRSATAQVSSPGTVQPMALSLDCLLNAAANVLPGAGLPFGYVASPHATQGPDRSVTDWPSTQPTDTQIKTTGVTPSSVPQNGLGPILVGSSGLDLTGLLTGQRAWVSFALGTGADRLTATLGPFANLAGLSSLTVPEVVRTNPGTWRVKVAVGTASAPTTWSANDATLAVTPAVSLGNTLACGRMLKSPRDSQEGTGRNFALNMQEGLDHPVVQHPSLATLAPPSTSAGLLGAIDVSRCSNFEPDIKDINGNLQIGKVPNCVMGLMSNDIGDDVTAGLLGPATTIPENTTTGAPARTVAGRLVCTSAWPCGRTTTVNGVTISDEKFDDYVDPARRSLLTASTFFNVSTYLQQGVPVVTPQSALLPSLYTSHRFMWVPVISTVGMTSAVGAGSYPVLTYRPVFIAQDVTPIPDPTGILGLTDTAMRLTYPGTTDQKGLLMKDGQVVAVRFMTIEPSALPAVSSSYTGPVTDYLGVGPKVIRLVR